MSRKRKRSIFVQRTIAGYWVACANFAAWHSGTESRSTVLSGNYCRTDKSAEESVAVGASVNDQDPARIIKGGFDTFFGDSLESKSRSSNGSVGLMFSFSSGPVQKTGFVVRLVWLEVQIMRYTTKLSSFNWNIESLKLSFYTVFTLMRVS